MNALISSSECYSNLANLIHLIRLYISGTYWDFDYCSQTLQLNVHLNIFRIKNIEWQYFFGSDTCTKTKDQDRILAKEHVGFNPEECIWKYKKFSEDIMPPTFVLVLQSAWWG
jgi:hypothetical protein